MLDLKLLYLIAITILEGHLAIAVALIRTEFALKVCRLNA